MSDANAAAEAAHAPAGNEPDRIATGQLVLWMVVVLAVAIVGIFGIRTLVYREAARQERAKALASVGKEAAALRAEMKKKLTDYGVVDAKRGIYRIPIDRAMKLVATNPALLRRVPAAPPPKKAAAAPPPAGGAATGSAAGSAPGGAPAPPQGAAR